MANQTTMYKKETQAIGKLLEKAVITAYGPEHAAQNFAAFDTICDATQVRTRTEGGNSRVGHGKGTAACTVAGCGGAR